LDGEPLDALYPIHPPARFIPAGKIDRLDEPAYIAGVVLVFRDITERLKAEERMRLAVEAAPNAMIMVSRDGRIELVNSQTEKLFGYSRDELLGQSVETLVPERYRAGHGALRAGFLREPVARPMGAGRDLFGLRKDGREVPIEIGLNPISTSQGTLVLASIIDISERKEAERRLALSEERLSLTLKFLPVGVGVVNAQGRVLIANPIFRKFLDGDIPSIDDTESRKWRAYYPDGRPIERENYPAIRALRGEEVVPVDQAFARQIRTCSHTTAAF